MPSKSNVIISSLLESIKGKDHKLYDILRSIDSRVSDIEGLSTDDILTLLNKGIEARTYSNDGATILTAVTTNPTLGNGTLNATYVKIGPLVYVDFNYVFGSTSNAGSGQYSIRLPFEAVNVNGSFQASLYIAGTASYACTAYVYANRQNVAVLVHSAGAWLTHNAPAAWTATSYLMFSGIYLTNAAPRKP